MPKTPPLMLSPLLAKSPQHRSITLTTCLGKRVEDSECTAESLITHCYRLSHQTQRNAARAKTRKEAESPKKNRGLPKNVQEIRQDVCNGLFHSLPEYSVSLSNGCTNYTCLNGEPGVMPAIMFPEKGAVYLHGSTNSIKGILVLFTARVAVCGGNKLANTSPGSVFLNPSRHSAPRGMSLRAKHNVN